MIIIPEIMDFELDTLLELPSKTQADAYQTENGKPKFNFQQSYFISLRPSLIYFMVNSQDYSWLVEGGMNWYIQISRLIPKNS